VKAWAVAEALDRGAEGARIRDRETMIASMRAVEAILGLDFMSTEPAADSGPATGRRCRGQPGAPPGAPSPRRPPTDPTPPWRRPTVLEQGQGRPGTRAAS